VGINNINRIDIWRYVHTECTICNINIKQCIESSNYQISMIIIEKRMFYKVIVCLNITSERCLFIIIATCMCQSGKVGVAGRFDPLSRDLLMP